MTTPASSKSWKRRLLFRGFSIQQRLPLLICALLLSMIFIFSYVSYVGVRNAAIKTGQSRLNSLSDQLSSLLAQSSQAMLTATRITVNNASLQECLEEPGSSSCITALQTLEKLRQDTSSVLVELLNANKRPVLRSLRQKNTVNFDSLAAIAHLDSGTVGKLYRVKDSLYYAITLGITSGNKLAGYVVRWRKISTTPKALEQLSALLGSKATFFVGNKDGSVWTDMIKPIPNPLPGNMRSPDGILEYSNPSGEKVFAAERSIRNTPWILVMEFPRQIILEPAHSFLRFLILIGSLLLLAGIFIAWNMSRNITRPLNKLTAAVGAITTGNYSPVTIAKRRDEVGKLARAFNAMNSQVQQAKAELEKKVIETEQMNEQLHSLSAYLQNIREQERMHIAREMHDELGQLLTAYKMDVSWLSRRMSSTDDPVVKEKLEEMSNIVNDTISFVRQIAAELRPSMLDDLGLIPALEWQSKEFTKRFNIETEFDSTDRELQTSDSVATGMFRMYQESLTNVARHSAAKKVVANLQVSGEQLCLSITDDGKGFDTTATKGKTLGLLGMKERALMLGGKLEIISEPGSGTTVIITVPVTERAKSNFNIGSPN